MEVRDGKRRLIHEWEGRSMEGDGCRCGCQWEAEAGARRENYADRLRRTESRARRMAQVLAVTLLLLVASVLALIITLGLERKAGNQINGQPSNCSSEKSGKQQVGSPTSSMPPNKDSKRPSAMLTAPLHNNTDGKFLQWESKLGNAFCQGGFNYTNGSLVVPKKGTYRIFLQITYGGEGIPCPGEVKLTNNVLSITPNYNMDVTLLASVDTMNCREGTWMKSLSTSGLFRLEANSRLRVTSSQPALIAKNEYQVFFGADLISE